MTGIAIIQDELAHAHMPTHPRRSWGRTRRTDLQPRPQSFRYPYPFDVPARKLTELVVANGMYDQAGFCLLGDIHDKCSYVAVEARLNK